MRFLQHAAGEVEAVIGEGGDVGIEVKRAVDRQKTVEPRLRQARHQHLPVHLVAVLDRLHLRAAVEGGFRRDLRQRRRGDGEVLMQPLDRTHQRRGRDHPADAPSGHAEILGEGIDDDAALGGGERRRGRKGVVEPVIDFIGDDGNAGVLGRSDQVRKRLGAHHGSRRIGGACDQHRFEGLFPVSVEQRVRRQRVSRFGRQADQSRLAAERGQDVTIGRVGGRGEPDAVARLQQGQKSERERGRRAGGDDDGRRIDRDPVRILIVPRDAAAQVRQPQAFGVAEASARQRRLRRGDRHRGRGGRRLAELHVDDVAPALLDARRRRHHVHRHEGRNVASLRGTI